jgi:hypothetical protein
MNLFVCSLPIHKRNMEGKLTNGQGKWERNTLHECWEKWHKDVSVRSHKSLPCTVMWAICLARNEKTFQNIDVIPIKLSPD